MVFLSDEQKTGERKKKGGVLGEKGGKGKGEREKDPSSGLFWLLHYFLIIPLYRSSCLGVHCLGTLTYYPTHPLNLLFAHSFRAFSMGGDTSTPRPIQVHFLPDTGTPYYLLRSLC